MYCIHSLYEIMNRDVKNNEWMYELEQSQVWGGYDMAARAFINGSTQEQAALLADDKANDFKIVSTAIGSAVPLEVCV